MTKASLVDFERLLKEGGGSSSSSKTSNTFKSEYPKFDPYFSEYSTEIAKGFKQTVGRTPTSGEIKKAASNLYKSGISGDELASGLQSWLKGEEKYIPDITKKAKEEEKQEKQAAGRKAAAAANLKIQIDRIKRGDMSPQEAASSWAEQQREAGVGEKKIASGVSRLEDIQFQAAGRKEYEKDYGKVAASTVKEFIGRGAKGQELKDILGSLRAKGITGQEVPSAIEQHLLSSPKYEGYIKTIPQRELEYRFGTMGRTGGGELTNTYRSVLTQNKPLARSYDLGKKDRLSISDIGHLQGVDLQNVVNAGMTKVANIRATSDLMGLIGYAFS
jgi:hypothetical protein